MNLLRRLLSKSLDAAVYAGPYILVLLVPEAMYATHELTDTLPWLTAPEPRRPFPGHPERLSCLAPTRVERQIWSALEDVIF